MPDGLFVFGVLSSALGFVVMAGLLIAETAYFRFPKRHPGKWMARSVRARRAAEREADSQIHQADTALSDLRLAVPQPSVWRRDLQQGWYLATKGLRWAGLLLFAIAVVPTLSWSLLGYYFTAENRPYAAAYSVLPSMTLMFMCFFLLRLDDVTSQRGRPEEYVRWLAVNTVIACGAHANRPSTSTIRQVDRQVQLLAHALTMNARFTYTADPVRRESRISEATRAGNLLSDRLEAIQCGQGNIADIAADVLHILQALDRIEPLRLVPDGVSPSNRSHSTASTPVIRNAAAYAAAIFLAVGTIAALSASGVDSQAVGFAVLALAPALTLPPFFSLGRLSRANRSANSTSPTS